MVRILIAGHVYLFVWTLLTMEVEKGGGKKADNYPLTVSMTAKEHAPPSTDGKPQDAEFAGAEDHVTSKANTSASGSSSAPVGRSRFYFESDALALKNNPE